MEGGRAFGSYNQIGMTLKCDSEDEAKRVVNLLLGEKTQ